MKKRPTLYLQRNAPVVKAKSKPNRLTEAIPNSHPNPKKSQIIMLKPFLHKEKSSGLYLYLGKKVKIFLGDL